MSPSGKALWRSSVPGGKVLVKPFDVPHLSANFLSLKKLIRELNGETRIVMECTGRYYEPVARKLSRIGFFVSTASDHP